MPLVYGKNLSKLYQKYNKANPNLTVAIAYFLCRAIRGIDETMPISEKPTPSLLIFHPGALGDLVVCFPAFAALKRRFAIDLLCQRSLGRLATALGICQGGFSQEAAGYAGLYADPPDPGLISWLSAYDRILLFSRSPELADRLRRSVPRPIYGISPRPDPRIRRHLPIYIANALESQGLLDSGWTRPALQEMAPSRWPGREDRPVILHPGSGSPRKNWDLGNFLILKRALAAQGKTALFLLGPAEEAIGERLAKQGEGHARVRGIADILELLALLQSAGGFIGNDSGVSHLAGFLGIPTVAVFGPSDPLRWKPWGARVKAVYRRDLDCEPCFERQRANCPNTDCLQGISPERVMEALNAVADSRHPD